MFFKLSEIYKKIFNTLIEKKNLHTEFKTCIASGSSVHKQGTLNIVVLLLR